MVLLVQDGPLELDHVLRHLEEVEVEEAALADYASAYAHCLEGGEAGDTTQQVEELPR